MGIDNVYILSAGWGLISAAFLTPYYDITFSQARRCVQAPAAIGQVSGFADAAGRDPRADRVLRRQGLPAAVRYADVFHQHAKTVFYNSAHVPQMPGYVLRRFETRTRTNWHYECANAFLDGAITTD